MSAGVVQPGGAGTTIFVYDNGASDAGGDGSYSFADILAAMNILRPGQSDIEIVKGSVSGLAMARPQYMVNVSIQLGGQAGDGNNTTTLKDLNCDVDWRSGGLLYRSNAGLCELRLGTQVGVGPLGLAAPTMDGKDGCTIVGGSMTYKADYYLFGCLLISSNIMQFLTTGGTNQNVAGCRMIASGANNIFGDSSSLGNWYRNVMVLTTGSNAINGMRQASSSGNTVVVVAALQSISSNQGTARIQGYTFVGVPSVSYLKPSAADASDWKIIDCTFQDDAPRVTYTADHTAAQGVQHFGRLNTHVEDGTNPLSGISVRLVSDVDGTVVDTATFGDGDLGFTHGPSGYANAVLLREYYRSGGVNMVRDRTFTLYVNMPGGAYPVNPAYRGKTKTCQWPGINTFKGTYQAGGGTFTPWFEPITLEAVQGAVANFGASVGGGKAPLTVTFTDESVLNDATISARAWTFGDGGTSSLQNPAHVYSAPGIYPVTLTLTTSLGTVSKTYAAMIFVQTGAPDQPYFQQSSVQAMLLGGGGQDLIWGATTVKAIVERRAAQILPGAGAKMVGLSIVATIETGTLPGVKAGDQVTTDGVNYLVSSVRQKYDGALTDLYLAVS